MKLMIVAILSVCGLSLWSEPLSVQHAIAMSLKTHPDMHLATLNHESAVVDSKSIQSALHPRLDGTVGYYPSKTFVMPVNGAFTTRQSDAFHADLTGSYTLWDGGRSHDRYSAALYNIDKADFNKDEAKNALIEEVLLRYYTLAYLESLMSTAEQSVHFYQAQYDRALHLRQNGLKTEADESRFYAYLSEAQERFVSAGAEADKVRLSLGLLVGSNEAIEIDKKVLDTFADSIDVSLAPNRTELSEQNPKLKSLKGSIDQAKALSDASAKEQYGSVSLIASYGYDNSLSSYDSSLIGAVGTIPLYEGGKLSAEAQKSRIALSVAQREYERYERILWQELFGSVCDLNRLEETIKAKKSVISSTQKALSLMEGRYAQGLATYVDVLESRSALDNASSELSGAKLQKILAWAHLQRLLNKGCENDVCKN